MFNTICVNCDSNSTIAFTMIVSLNYLYQVMDLHEVKKKKSILFNTNHALLLLIINY